MRRFIIFPILIAAHPIVAVFAASGKWQPIEDYARFAGLSILVVVLAWLVLATLMSNSARAAFAIATFWLLLFSYGSITRQLAPLDFWTTSAIFIAVATIAAAGSSRSRSRKGNISWVAILATPALLAAVAFLVKPFVTEGQIFAGLWTVVVVLTSWWAGSSQSAEKLVPYLNIAAIGLIALPAYDMVEICREGADLNKSLKPPTVQVAQKPVAPLPDVYHFVLDGYGRADVLKNEFGYDNTPFLKALQSRGFFVASRSRTNYAQTEKSLASELNANYLYKLVPEVNEESKNRSLFVNLIRDNGVARAMQQRGYEYTTISTGFSPFNRDSAREDLSDPSGPSLAEQLMLYQTPEAGFGLSNKSLTQMHRDRIEHAFDSAVDAPPSNKPRYVLIHVLSPHPPFVFDQNGRPVQPKQLHGIWDADLFVNAIGSRLEYTVGYPKQLKYINKRLLETIDKINKNSKTPPVFILQGDHGPRRDHSMKSLDSTDVAHSYPNLVAVRGPAPVTKNMYNGITSVNVMRAVLAGLFGGKFEKLPDRSYYSTWAQPYENTDITDRVR